MNREKITRMGVQVVAVCLGLLGLVWMGLGLYFAVSAIREAESFQVYYMTPLFLLLGGILMAVAWQNVRHFGAEAIRSVVALVAFFTYMGMSMLLRPLQDATLGPKTGLHYSATFLLPFLVAYLLYRVLSRRLIQMVTVEGSEHASGGGVSPRAEADVETLQK